MLLVLVARMKSSQLKKKEVLCSQQRGDLLRLARCSHDEADTRMLLHAADAVHQGHQRIMLRTVDSDVLVM